MMFLFAGHSAGLLSKNFVKQRLHENFRIPAPWLTKEIIFVCTVFLLFTLWDECLYWVLLLVFWIDGFY